MKILLFANTDWYLFNFRRSLAELARKRGHDVVLVAPSGPYFEKLRAMGFRCFEAPMGRRSLNPISEIRLLIWLYRLLKSEQITVVHGFTIKCVVYASLAGRLASSRGGIPARIGSVTGLGYVFSNNDIFARLLRPIVRQLLGLSLSGPRSHVILQNEDDLRFFREQLKLASSQTTLIPGSGVDVLRFSPDLRERTNKDVGTNEPVRVLLASRLLWDKGIGEFIEAARMLRRAGKPYRFIVAGTPDPGNPATVPASLANRWVAEGAIEWVGHADDMPKLLGSVDLVVLPSYREGLPKTLIEAAACGLPIITTDAPGCREVISNGVEGLLIPTHDSRALAEAIDRLSQDAQLRRAMGAAARNRALALFDDKIVNEGTLVVYQRALAASEMLD